MLIELKIIFFPRETSGSESKNCDFALTVLPKLTRIMVYLLLHSLAAQAGSLLYVFLNCLLPKMKTL